jgi:hypothetical protein
MLQDRAARPDGANDVLKVSDAPGEAVDASDHQDVAGMQEFQHRAQRLAALGRGAAPLLRPDDLTTGRLERRLLDGEVLIGRAHPGIPNDGHGRAPLSRLALLEIGKSTLLRLKKCLTGLTRLGPFLYVVPSQVDGNRGTKLDTGPKKERFSWRDSGHRN